MKRLNELHDLMRDYNGTAAPGSECAAWGDFIKDCMRFYRITPWDDRAAYQTVDDDFTNYWTAVAGGASPDYHAATGDIIEATP